jgi:hypothetical protein
MIYCAFIEAAIYGELKKYFSHLTLLFSTKAVENMLVSNTEKSINLA